MYVVWRARSCVGTYVHGLYLCANTSSLTVAKRNYYTRICMCWALDLYTNMLNIYGSALYSHSTYYVGICLRGFFLFFLVFLFMRSIIIIIILLFVLFVLFVCARCSFVHLCGRINGKVACEPTLPPQTSIEYTL